MYVRFRRQALRDGRHFQSGDAATLFLNRSLISSDEVDVLLLVMLRNAGRIIQHAEGRRLQLTGQPAGNGLRLSFKRLVIKLRAQ
jgi:hypothetical protein